MTLHLAQPLVSDDPLLLDREHCPAIKPARNPYRVGPPRATERTMPITPMMRATLIRLRMDAGLSMGQLAAAAGRSGRWLYDLHSGHTKTIRQDMYDAMIAACLDAIRRDQEAA